MIILMLFNSLLYVNKSVVLTLQYEQFDGFLPPKCLQNLDLSYGSRSLLWI